MDYFLKFILPGILTGWPVFIAGLMVQQHRIKKHIVADNDRVVRDLVADNTRVVRDIKGDGSGKEEG